MRDTRVVPHFPTLSTLEWKFRNSVRSNINFKFLWNLWNSKKSLISEHVLKKIYHCTFRAWKLEFMQNFWMNDLLLHTNFYFSSQIFEWLFYYCTNSLSSLHISSHHCTFCASLHKTSVETSPELSCSYLRLSFCFLFDIRKFRRILTMLLSFNQEE